MYIAFAHFVWARSIVSCQSFWQITHFRGPLVHVQVLPCPSRVSLVRPVISKCLLCRLLKFRLQTWQNGSFGNSFLLCFFSSNVDKIIQNCQKYLFWGKRTPIWNQVRYYNVLAICCSQEPTNRLCWLTLWYKPHIRILVPGSTS